METNQAKSPPMKHIDFAALRRRTNHQDIDNGGWPSPIEIGKEDHYSLVAQLDTQRMQLISPPPEEMLSLRRVSGSRSNSNPTPHKSQTTISATPARSVSKRKRGPPTPAKPSSSSVAVTVEANTAIPTVHKTPQLPEATPNPKPRKQRHVLASRESFTFPPSRPAGNTPNIEMETTPTKPKKAVVVKSPHTKNPDADYIPPLVLASEDGVALGVNTPTVVRRALKARGSRRSATPIPPYEPPPDIFTSPREVFLKPVQPKSISKSSKRKSLVNSSRKGKALRVDTTKQGNMQVKQELPDDLDLLAPMPPPSPTDDPLLLRGQLKPKPSKSRMEVSEVKEAKAASVQVQTEQLSDDLPPSSPHAPLNTDEIEAIQQSDWYQDYQYAGDQSTEDSMMQLDPQDADVVPVRLFDFDVGAMGDGGWSDSDDEPTQENEEEGEGEYTGKWRMLKIRTKQDPPSSATRTRQELWGRPISPFPKMTTLDMLGEELEEEEEVRKMSVEPESHDSKRTADVTSLNEETVFPNPENQPSNIQVNHEIHETDEDEDGEDTDTDDEPDLVKITSVDPRAAARAVAILKQHDYDCYTKLVKKRRSSHSAADDFAKETRRRSAFGSGVTKSVNRQRRRSTIGVIGDKVIIPGSPIMTLPELLQQTEQEVVHERSNVWSARTSFATPVEVRDPFKTPLVNKLGYKAEAPMTPTPDHYPTGEREWTKHDWKLLDACFTDVRLGRAYPSLNRLAPVDVVRLEDVISRFLDLMGGQPLVDTFGESWTRDNLLQRAHALMKKQSSGNVAPPTTPATPLPFPTLCAMSAAFGGANSAPTMDVPDFTPLRKALSRPVLPLPVVENAPFESVASADESQIRVPPTLLAPRYSHLLEEATALGQHNPTSMLWHDDHKGTRNQQPEGVTFPIRSGEASPADDSADSHAVSRNVDQPPAPQIETASSLNKQVTTTMSNRVKGFFASYLPTLSDHPKSRQKSLKPTQPGLPLPPPSVLEKSRGPISTPIRPPVPRVPHPKELVRLNPAPPPPSHIPRAKVVPKRLVELVPVLPPPQEPKEFKTGIVPRPRRSSGSSVKDLVRGFEQMEKITVDEMQLKKTGDIDNMRSWRQHQFSKPRWKP